MNSNYKVKNALRILSLCRKTGREGVPKSAGLVGGFHADDLEQKALP